MKLSDRLVDVLEIFMLSLAVASIPGLLLFTSGLIHQVTSIIVEKGLGILNDLQSPWFAGLLYYMAHAYLLGIVGSCVGTLLAESKTLIRTPL